MRVPSEAEEQLRSLHRQREQLVKTRKQLEAQGRSLMVNHGIEPVKGWWKERTFQSLILAPWLKDSLGRWQAALLVIQAQVGALTLQLQTGATPNQPRVAVARQLAVDLWRIKTGRVRAEELGLIH